jgi:ATP-dependent DNA helicase PIF1
MPLNEEQARVLESAIEGKSLFITGPGGVGKSYLVHHIIRELEGRGKRVSVTALTGCASLLLGGTAKTIHSWSGIGIGRDCSATIVKRIQKYNFKAKKRWICTDVLIIDEVSMLSLDLFEKISTVGSVLRKNPKPFGGLQVILVGDFYQLPPVNKEVQTKDAIQFAFQSPIWAEMGLDIHNLRTIVRQSEPHFQRVLNEAREGVLSEESRGILMERKGVPWEDLKIRPTLLFSRRVEVDMINEYNLNALKGNKYVYDAKTVFDATLCKGLDKSSPEVQNAVEKLDRSAPYRGTLTLKVGAQVMLTYNMNPMTGLVNGSRGIVEGFTETEPILPIVLFKGHRESIPVPHNTWESEDIEGVKRMQIPLILAYAITIHKCQGATLDSALVDIGRSTFEVGQAYVALSRVKSLDSLYIYDFEPEAFIAHPKVKEFYASLR